MDQVVLHKIYLCRHKIEPSVNEDLEEKEFEDGQQNGRTKVQSTEKSTQPEYVTIRRYHPSTTDSDIHIQR